MAGVIGRFSIINHQQSGSESDGQIWVCQDSVHTPSLYSHRAEGRNCMHLCICVYIRTYVHTGICLFIKSGHHYKACEGGKQASKHGEGSLLFPCTGGRGRQKKEDGEVKQAKYDSFDFPDVHPPASGLHHLRAEDLILYVGASDVKRMHCAFLLILPSPFGTSVFFCNRPLLLVFLPRVHCLASHESRTPWIDISSAETPILTRT